MQKDIETLSIELYDILDRCMYASCTITTTYNNSKKNLKNKHITEQ